MTVTELKCFPQSWRGKSNRIIFGVLLAWLLCISCATAIVFQDNFDDNSLNPVWTFNENGGPQVAETNQQVEITIPSTSSGSMFTAGIQICARYGVILTSRWIII